MKPRHVPGLDGLRGLAVLGVLFFHANGLLRGGYLGVDLFFVLSGFLITSILLAEHRARGAIDLKMFWVRRSRRLLPALLALMPAVALYAKVLASPSELGRIRSDALATLAYVANWSAVFARRSYWEMFAAPSPLEHTWSLAIEEQFYVVWPLVVAGVLRLARARGHARPARTMFAVCVALGIAACAAMVVLYEGGDSTRVYLGTDTRGAAILAGAALACSGLGQREGAEWSPARRRLLDTLGVLAALGLGVAWARLDGASPLLYGGGFWATEVGVLVLITCTLHSPAGPVARALSWSPLRAVGNVSYGVYLWHWPVYVVLSDERTKLTGLSLLALRLAVTFGIAWVSFRFLERPIRERGLPWGRPLVVVPGAFGLATASVVFATRGAATTGAPTAGVDPRDPTGVAAVTAPVASADASPRPPPLDRFPPEGERAPAALRVLVLGDSVALSLGMSWYWARGGDDPYVVQRAVGDCSILDSVAPTRSKSGRPHGNGDCADHWTRDVTELRPDVALVVIGGAFYSTVKLDGRWRAVCDAPWRAAYAKRLAELLRAMAPFASRRVVALPPYPVGKWQSPTLVERVDCYLHALRDAARAADAEVLDLAGYLCPKGECVVTSEGAPVRPDGLHFAGVGANETVRWIMGELRRPTRLDGGR